MVVAALDRARNLHKIIQQVENGDVARIRERYGPQEGRAAHSMWPKIKLAVTRRERVSWELMVEFGGDRDRFFGFFVKQASSRKRKAVEGDNETVAYRKLVQAISRRDRDLQDEQENNVIYRDDRGEFSESRWLEKWGTLNRWEVWRALGKEQY